MVWQKIMTNDAKKQLLQIAVRDKELGDKYRHASPYERAKINSMTRQLYDQKAMIEKLGVSGRERGAIMKELKKHDGTFKEIYYNNNFGLRTFKYVGFSKTLGLKVRITKSRDSAPIMMSDYSYSGKAQIDSIEVWR